MKKLNNKGFSVVEMLLVLIVIGALAGVGWYVYQNRDDYKKDEPKKATSSLSIKALVAQVKSRVAKEVPTVKTADPSDSYKTVDFRAEGYGYMTMVNADAWVTYAPKDPQSPSANESEAEAAAKHDKDAIAPAYDTIIKLIEDNGFSKVGNYPAKDLVGDGASMYERSADVCLVIKNVRTGISCVDKASFVDVAKEVDPFVKAFRKSDDAKNFEGTTLSFSQLTTGTGETADDKYAQLSIGPAGAWFYQEDGEWVYFTASNEGFSCEQTKTNPQAAKAFAKTCRKPGEGL